MKARFFIPLILLCVLLQGVLVAQPHHRCGTTEYMELQKQLDPLLESRMAAEEVRMQQYLSGAKMQSAPVVIRVVVHVVWNTSPQNISDTQILSQIDVLNEDYNRMNADAALTPSVFLPVAADANIQFCLATVDPNGNPTTGINRIQTAVTNFTSNNTIKSSATGGADPWDPNSYLNIWVGNLGGGLLGYAQFPGGNPATSGVVLLYNAFGRTGNLVAPYNKGRVATHEIAHALNLRHIWGDATCGNDFVADTPTQQSANFGCPVFPKVTCSNGPNGDMFMNFMDYTDDACMNLFTQGQAARMQAAIAVSYPGLISGTSCVPYLKKVSGSVFYDTNQNGVQDAGEPGMKNRSVQFQPVNQLLVTNGIGNYAAYVDSGTYSISMVPDPLWNVTSTPVTHTVTIDTSDICCRNFGLAPTATIDHVSISYVSGQMRCGFSVPSWLTITNDGTTIAGGILRFVPDPQMTLISSLPNYDSSSGDTLYYNYTNLYPGQSLVILLIYEMPLTPGLILCTNSFASIFDGTIYQPITENLFCDTITCSFDPNDKAVIPPGVQAAHYILKTDSLLYTIRFQNEGNDTAFTVVLRDQLSNLLDRNTLELVASSHPVTVSISATNLAEFRYENILLPWKAIDDPGSQGFVQFRIVPFQGLPDGTLIENDAGIYFDFNPPVITNLTHVTLVTTIPVGVNEINSASGIRVQPQPFSDFCDIIFDDGRSGGSHFSISDITGRVIQTGLTSEGKRNVLRLETSGWKRGIYFLRLEDEVVRLVKF